MNSATDPESSFRWGPRWLDADRARFHVWAPGCDELRLVLESEPNPLPIPMQRDDEGGFSCTVEASAPIRYRFQLPDGQRRPDPLSRYQPDGVHGASLLPAPDAFAWSDHNYRGVARSALLIYELHIGTFTLEGTYRAAMERLDELVDLGITAIELMPLNETAGQRNWGYDGVQWFAPQHQYGTPEDLQRFIDAAHARGLAVILDVVYNHYGPEGNYLHGYGGYVSKTHKTSWGDAPNFDGPGKETMRSIVLENLRYWIEKFHFDGLRVDALHCMLDKSPTHVVREMGQAFAQLRARSRYPLHLIAESNVYDPELLADLDGDGYGFDLIWSDCFLHSIAAIQQPDKSMSNRLYDPDQDLQTSLDRGYVYQGTLRLPRRRLAPEEAPDRADLERLIFCIQNHDFVGNHPTGLRLHAATSPDAHRAAAALLLLHPAVPMLFMGEELASPTPFLFFTDFQDPRLRRGVERGRRREYPQHDWKRSDSPLDEASFTKSKLVARTEGDRAMRSWYRRLIALRHLGRSEGWLRSEALTVQPASASWPGPQLHYQTDQHDVTVAVHVAPHEPKLDVWTSPQCGEILLSQNVEPGSEPSTIQAHPHAVLVHRSPRP